MYNIVCNVNNVVCITYNNIAFLQNLINFCTTYFRVYCILQQQFDVTITSGFFKSVVQCGVCAPPSDKSVKTVNT